MTRRNLLASAFQFASVAGFGASARAESRVWPLGLNTYCLRFLRLNDRQLFDYCVARKMDAIFLQDSLDPGIMDPKHWADVAAWAKESGMRIETGGGAILPPSSEGIARKGQELRKHIQRAKAMGSVVVRANLAADRYSLPVGPVERHVETAVKVLQSVRAEAIDAGVKIGFENHKDLQAWQTRELIVAAGTDFVGAYLDTGNPVFVAEDPFTTLEELGPFAVSLHLRDSVVYEHPDGVAVQWVPLGQGSIDFRKLLERAMAILPPVAVYCKPITARPPVVLPVYSEEFWSKWFPRARSRDLARFLALARAGRPWNQPHLTADLPQLRELHFAALSIQQAEHMERSLDYCRTSLNLGVRWRA